ncbi:MAG: NAD-dependent epimerase/dehydratase family protein [Bryobacter sp.]|nr:NAD-dependent epimerase/dehydratase family protein [Bryobacter sp.]
MPRALVTGATGFVGWHVARQLLERGWEVRALARRGKVPELEIETIHGDLRDRSSVERAAEGCDALFHVAADYRLWTAKPEEMYASNVEGTRNVLRACRKMRAVYCSTVGAIGMRPGLLADEDSPVSLADMKGHYKRSKFQAEAVAREAAAEGMDVVIVNPTTPLGEADRKPTPTGKVVVDFLAGKIPAYIDTGLNYVDVRDVADGHWLAYERGKRGERYILGSENLTLIGMLQRLAKVSGKAAPTVELPYFVAYTAAAVSTAWAGLTGKAPGIPLDGVRYAHTKMWVNCEKAKRDLGYAPQTVDGALGRAVAWFREHGYV